MTTRHSTMMQIRSLGSLMFSFNIRPQYMLVSYHGAPDSVAIAKQWCEEMEAYGARRRRQCLVLDATSGDNMEDDVDDILWTWLQNNDQFDTTAILLKNRMVRVRVDLKAKRLNLQVRAFGDEEEANAWIEQLS